MERDTVLAYKTFKGTEEFETWQIENPDLDVISIQPFLGSANLDSREHNQEACIETNTAVFVAYRKQVAKIERSFDFSLKEGTEAVNEEQIQADYDSAADILYISFGEPRKGVAVEVEDGDVVRIDPYTDEIVGVTIMDFRKRYRPPYDAKIVPRVN